MIISYKKIKIYNLKIYYNLRYKKLLVGKKKIRYK